jgi:hypothetical protein
MVRRGSAHRRRGARPAPHTDSSPLFIHFGSQNTGPNAGVAVRSQYQRGKRALMARFVRANFSSYNSLGMPTLDGEEAWLNVDQIVHIEEHLGNNLLRRHQNGGEAPEQHYPCLLITTSDGRERLISLGITASVEDGAAVLESGLSDIVGGAPRDKTDSDTRMPKC